MTPLQTLLNDEQKAFEEFCLINEMYIRGFPVGKIKSLLALHDQKIITAVIGMCENGDYNDVLPALYEALKKEMV